MRLPRLTEVFLFVEADPTRRSFLKGLGRVAAAGAAGLGASRLASKEPSASRPEPPVTPKPVRKVTGVPAEELPPYDLDRLKKLLSYEADDPRETDVRQWRVSAERGMPVARNVSVPGVAMVKLDGEWTDLDGLSDEPRVRGIVP